MGMVRVEVDVGCCLFVLSSLSSVGGGEGRRREHPHEMAKCFLRLHSCGEAGCVCVLEDVQLAFWYSDQ